MFEPVFVTRNSYMNSDGGQPIEVIPSSVGIVKVYGCHQFFVAVKGANGLYGGCRPAEHGLEYISVDVCKKRYGSIPEPGEAWLVQERKDYISWDREDQNMFLLNENGSYCKND